MTSDPKDAIPLATPETSATTQNKCARTYVRVAAVFLFGVPAVVLLVVASAIYDSNKKKYWDCYDAGFNRKVNTDGCADRGSYACVTPGLPTTLVWIASVLALLSAIAGIRWSCNEWCACSGVRGKSCCVGCPPSVIATCFLILELLAAAYYGFTLFLFVAISEYFTEPPRSTLGTGRCCCDFTDLGESQMDSPAILAGMAAAVTIFGAGHLLAAKRAEENQKSSAWESM